MTWKQLGGIVAVLILLVACLHRTSGPLPALSGSFLQELPQEPVTTLTVMTYNINYGRDSDGTLDLEATQRAMIQGGLPDLIGLQEVDVRYARRSLHEDQVRTLAEGLGMYYAYGPALSRIWNGYFGNALLSKYPIVEVSNHRLPQIGTQEDRSFLHAVVDVPGFGLVNVIVTHLGLKAQERLSHVQTILEYTTRLEGPVILLGDWNAEREDSLWLLEEHYVDAGRLFDPQGSTFPSSSSTGARIDRVYLSPDLVPKAYQVIDAQASDHRPVVVKIEKVNPEDRH